MGTITIYKIEFADGTAYIGQTTRSLNRRIYEHKTDCVSTLMAEKFNAKMPYKVEVIETYPMTAWQHADHREQVEIEKLEQPINVFNGKKLRRVRTQEPSKKNFKRGFHGTRQRINPIREGSYICSKCRVRKPHTEYHKDRTRFNGLYSQCKDCKKAVAQLRKQHKTKATPEPKNSGLF